MVNSADTSPAGLPASTARRVLLILILALLSFLKLLHHPPPGYYGADGSTYFQIARQVYEGDGLRTSVSVYHQGLKHLPAPTTIYPLWPLVLGYAGRVLGLDRAAHLVPELLYVGCLLLLYALANRLMSAWSRTGDPRIARGAPVDLGHVAVLLFGLNAIFFRYSSLPYTDALALFATFAALLALARHLDGGSAPLAALAGALAGAAYLARTQMIVVPLALLATLAAVAVRGGPGARRALLATACATLAVVTPWFLFLGQFVQDPHPMMLVDVFTYHRETPEVPPVVWIAPPASLGALLREILEGLRVAFAPRGASWVRSFGPVAWVVPLAAMAVACSRRLRAALRASRRRVTIVGVVLAGTGLGVMSLAAHSESDFARLWSFDHRHGLPFVVLLVSALACLLGATQPDARAAATAADVDSPTRGQRALRALTLGLLAVSLAQAVWTIPATIAERGRGPTRSERALARWLAARPETPVVIARRASRLAVVSRASFHWIACSDDADVTRALFRHAGAEYVVTRPSDHECGFLRGLEPELELVETFRGGGAPLELYRWRGAAALSGATS